MDGSVLAALNESVFFTVENSEAQAATVKQANV
jgi:hypothetical protein